MLIFCSAQIISEVTIFLTALQVFLEISVPGIGIVGKEKEKKNKEKKINLFKEGKEAYN